MEVKELLKNIQFINSKFSDADWVKGQNGNVLSYTALKLAAMKAYLVDEKESAHKAAMRLEIEMDKEKAAAFKRAAENGTATAAKDGKYDDKKFIKARQAYADAKVYYEKLKSVTADTHDLIESIRSRIIDLQSSRKDESIR